jgi:hypothetical protein
MNRLIRWLFCGIAFFFCGCLSFAIGPSIAIIPFPAFAFWLVLISCNRTFFDTPKKRWKLFLFSIIAWYLAMIVFMLTTNKNILRDANVNPSLISASLAGAYLMYAGIVFFLKVEFKKSFVYFYSIAALVSTFIILYLDSDEYFYLIGGIWQTILGLALTIGIDTRKQKDNGQQLSEAAL